MKWGLFGCGGLPGPAKQGWRSRSCSGGLIGVIFCLISCASTPDPALIALPRSEGGGIQTAKEFTARGTDGVLLVRRLTIPEYMMSRRVRFWTDNGYLAEWPDTYWAERIEIGMSREFVAILREQLPGWTICDATCLQGTPDVILKVDLLRLDVIRGQRRIEAIAQIQAATAQKDPLRAPKTNASHQTPLITVPISSDTAQGEAQALALVLQGLARAAATSAELAWVPAAAHP